MKDGARTIEERNIGSNSCRKRDWGERDKEWEEILKTCKHKHFRDKTREQIFTFLSDSG